jgi:hypothetical protein
MGVRSHSSPCISSRAFSCATTSATLLERRESKKQMAQQKGMMQQSRHEGQTGNTVES